MTPHLYGKLLHILQLRGIVPVYGDFRLVDAADGLGPRIEVWNARLGARPTQAEIDAVTDADALAALRRQTRERENALRPIRAMAIATHKRLLRLETAMNTLVPTFTPITAAAWQQAIETEWDNLG